MICILENLITEGRRFTLLPNPVMLWVFYLQFGMIDFILGPCCIASAASMRIGYGAFRMPTHLGIKGGLNCVEPNKRLYLVAKKKSLPLKTEGVNVGVEM